MLCLLIGPERWGGGKMTDLERFDALPFKYKIVFTDVEYPLIKSAVCLSGLRQPNKPNKQVYSTKSFITGKRYIDQFDYIDFFNKISL